MSSKLKGLYKSFKCISQIFVLKDREMEIGYPTDVKHVAHIGLDGCSSGDPSGMTEFKAAQESFSGPFGEMSERRDSSFTAVTARTTWSSQDFDQSIECQPPVELFKDIPQVDPPNIPKKTKRKKSRSSPSPKSSSSSGKSSRASKTKAAQNEMEAVQSFQH